MTSTPRRPALAAVVVVTVLAAAGLVSGAMSGCGRTNPAGDFNFDEVPAESSGLTFRHELPGSILDNLTKSAMGGVVLIDFDGDGRVDVYFPNGGWDDRLAGESLRPARPPKSRLYRNLGAMKFEDVTDKAGVGLEAAALGGCVGDFDGDGRADMFVCVCGQPALYRNKGDGTFEDVAAKAGLVPGFYAGATFLDYDRDGTVDLFASQYVDPAEPLPLPNNSADFGGPAAYRAQPSRLWRGRGDGTFEDVTTKARVGTPGKGMGVLATDLDDDGWIDLLVANDSMPNFAWRNQRDGTFADAGGRMGLDLGLDGEPRASMGVTAVDLDADGRLDYLLPDTRGGVAYIARERHYTDRAIDWGLAAATHRFTGWTDVAIDAENDGRPDVWKVHGSIRRLSDTEWTTLVSNHGPGEKGGMAFIYDPPPAGSEIEAAQVAIVGRGGISADFDGDGREDLLAVELNGRARLLRNVTERTGHWIRIQLVAKSGNTMALGARLMARTPDLRIVREVSSATGYISAPDPRIFIGLGNSDELNDIIVRWPSGKEQRVGTLDADRDHTVEER